MPAGAREFALPLRCTSSSSTKRSDSCESAIRTMRMTSGTWTCSVDEAPLPLVERFKSGATFAEVLVRAKDNAELWQAVYKRAQVTADAAKRAAALHKSWH